MMSTPLLIAVIIGALIIMGLASYAGYLLARLYYHNRQQKQQELERLKRQQEQIEQHNQKLESDIRTIAAATLQKQCELSECVIRIAVLMSRFATLAEPLPDFVQQYAAIYGLYDKVKHHPTHQRYAALEKKQRMKLRVERMQHEAEWQDPVNSDLEKLLATASLLAS